MRITRLILLPPSLQHYCHTSITLKNRANELISFFFFPIKTKAL